MILTTIIYTDIDNIFRAGCNNADAEQQCERYLQSNPKYMKKYMQRNMGFVNNFAQQHCSREQVTSWLDKKKPAGNKPPASENTFIVLIYIYN